jgi:membrane associated rhomboid family serine protease
MIRTLRDAKRARWTWAMVSLLIVVHLLVEAYGPRVGWNRLYESAGLSRERFLGGNYAGLITYSLIHASWTHLACNAVLLFSLGIRLESWLGAKSMNVLCWGGALCGGIMHLCCGGKPSDLLVGASGAVMAMLLVLCGLSPQSRMFPLPLSARNIGAGVLLSSLILMLLHPDAGVPLFSHGGKYLSTHGCEDWFRIGHACHFGGACFGWVYARWLMRSPPSLQQLQKDRAKREAALSE